MDTEVTARVNREWKLPEPFRAAQLEQSDSHRNSVNPKWSELFVFLTDCVLKQRKSCGYFSFQFSFQQFTRALATDP